MSEPLNLEVESAQARHVIHVPPERRQWRIADILRRVNLPLNTRCGQRGLCDSCMIELLAGTLVHAATGRPAIANGEPVTLRGCEYRPGESGLVKVRIPPRSMLAYQPQIVTDYRINISRAHDPLLQTMVVSLADVRRTSLAQMVAGRLNTELLVRVAGPAQSQIESLAGADPVYVTVSMQEDHWLVREVMAVPSRAQIGAAIDIGTTTVAVLLVDMSNGNVLARTAAFNQQMHLGDDVVTRITLCTSDRAMIGQLQDAVAQRTIAPLLEEAVAAAGVLPEQVACITIAGNTTMQHLVAGVDPSSMGVAPFTPVFLNHRVFPADAILKDRVRRACRSDATIHLLPGPAAYVGADLSAGVVASGLIYDDGPSLLVDVGTNGEIILKHNGKLYGCATAAGPAFEGAGLSSGIRAGDGAISQIRLFRDPFSIRAKWIGQGNASVRPAGLCGSAYVDFLAQGRHVGFLSPAGRFDREAVPDVDGKVIPWASNDLALQIATSPNGQPIVISQRDVSRLLQAKAAIAAGILTLLERVGLQPRQIKTLYLAGGFGTHMDRQHAIDCGLLPGFTLEQIQTVGNTALAGAYIALLDSSVMRELARIGDSLQVVELNLDPSFENRYIDQLALA